MPKAKVDKLTKVEVGQVVKVDLPGYTEMTVKPPCENKTSGTWYCATHKMAFMNQLQKDVHIGNGKAHQLAWACFEHGLEQP